jgi:folate-dependent phosphoribosylglycinamide formyltransferase PurN
MSGAGQSDDEYRVVLLSKAGVGGGKRETLARLADTDGITVAGVVVEDMIHGSLPEYVTDLLRKVIRRRGRGYPVRGFNAARDIAKTVRSRLSPTESDGDGDTDPDDDPLADVPVREVSDMLSDRAASEIRAMDPNLAIVWGTRILPRRVFDIPTDGSIGVHAGKIPEYRGGPAGFWELYYGENEAGVTVQKLNEELDAGQIIKQETVPIDSGDTAADVRAKQQEITADLVIEAVRGLADGSLEPRGWDGTKGRVNTPPTIPQLVRFWLRGPKQHR